MTVFDAVHGNLSSYRLCPDQLGSPPKYCTVLPHLSVGYESDGAALDEAGTAIERGLPVTARVAAVQLVACAVPKPATRLTCGFASAMRLGREGFDLAPRSGARRPRRSA